MNPPPQSTEHMILFHSNGWDKGLSPEEMQRIMSQTMAWFDRLYKEGKAKAAQPLFEVGKYVSGKAGSTVSDGPFAESKETIGGYLMLNVDNFDEAVEIAKGWPLLECGSIAEVRPVAPECPSFKLIREQMQHAAA